MLISTRGRYALRVLVDLTEQGGECYITLREIAQRQDISEKYLESIVKALVKAGYLDALRGKGGGYRLARGAEEMNVYEVLRVMEGALAPVACLEDGYRPCARTEFCRTLPLWKGLDEVVRAYLSGFTIRDLAEQTSGTDSVL